MFVLSLGLLNCLGQIIIEDDKGTPIALYPMRDLHAAKDESWMRRYPSPDKRIALGEVGVTGDGPLAIVTYGNGHYLSQQAAPFLAAEGIGTRVIDIDV